MAGADNYGYGGYKKPKNDNYNYRLEEAKRKAALAKAAKAKASGMANNTSYQKYQGQADDRKDTAYQKWYQAMMEKQKQAKIDYDKQQRLGYKLVNMPANQSGISLQKIGSNMNKTLEAGLKAIDHAGEVYQQLSRQQGSSNNAYSNRYNPSAFTPTGSQYGYSNPGWNTGVYGGQFGNMNKPYTYGQTLTPDDYSRMAGNYKELLLNRIASGIVGNQSAVPENMTKIPGTEETFNDYLDALRYGTRGGGMASQGYTGVDTYVPPETITEPPPPPGGDGGGGGDYPYYEPWADMNLRGGGGYGGGYGGYGGYGGNNYRITYNNNYRGGTGGTRANDVNTWYANMVNWNIGRPKGG